MQTHETRIDARGERILEAAMRLILRYGYDKTTMQDIAAEASVSKSALYQYWKSKEELFAILLIRETRQVFREWLAEVEADPEGGTLLGIYRHCYRRLLAHPLMMAVYTKESLALGSYMRQRDPQLSLRVYLLNRMLVIQFQAAGLIRDDLSPRVINHLLGILSVGLFSIHELIPQEETPPFEEAAEALALMVHRALAPASPGNSEQGKRTFRNFLEQWMGSSPE